MKTYSAEQFNKKPGQVYREADKNGSVQIKHAHYPDVVFVLTTDHHPAVWFEPGPLVKP